MERGGMAALPPAVVAANADKAGTVAAAQRAGRVSDRHPAGDLLLLVIGLSMLGSAELAPAPDADALADRRRMVTDAVTRMTRPGTARPANTIDDEGGN
ncbi:hypothetical protein V6V47_25965 [Micromonospora sp. CPCC 205539]|uniref:hypothetical protein n=1 Tax=Micromonospora sp. CPCC 205539 TaxID=3122408 RepID=UPI002FF0AA12